MTVLKKKVHEAVQTASSFSVIHTPPLACVVYTCEQNKRSSFLAHCSSHLLLIIEA
jgi:hypothetical protein